MRRVLVVTLLFVLAGGLGFGVRGQTPQFRTATHEVSVYVTVFDTQGHLVPNLTKDDFDVYDDGKLQDLSLFSNDLQPIKLVMMLDRSGSMVSNFDLERDAAVQFVTHLLDADKVRIGSFSNRVQIDPPTFTSDRDALVRILHEDLQEPGVTPLWNATSAAMTALAPLDGRRVVLLFTDGYDNPERPGYNATFSEVHERSQSDDIMVYAIGLADGCGPGTAPLQSRSVGPNAGFEARYQGPAFPPRGGPDRSLPGKGGIPKPPSPLNPGSNTPGPGISIPLDKIFGHGRGDSPCSGAKPDPGLKDLAADGGGGYFELHGTDDMAATFSRIADELHHQYLLAFTPARLDGKRHALEVRVHRPGLIVRARPNYTAK